MVKMTCENINKIYPSGVHAVKDFNLVVEDKDFIVLVGPSGCGKSTMLRMIVGLEGISTGNLYIENQLVNHKAPKDRNIAMVFQDYALYPSQTVYENTGFSLTIRKFKSGYKHKKIMRAANILELKDFLNRKPEKLSGGQQQRVALGRAIVRDPKIFLMDEPLSNLDAKLRQQMRIELVKLHSNLGATTVYVTHDQTEAMTMATRIVVMKDGEIQQIGVPKEIYDNPANMFVGGFIGTPPMNFINGILIGEYFVIKDENKKQEVKIKLPTAHLKRVENYQNKPLVLGIRPENFAYYDIDNDNIKENTIEFVVEYSELLGNEYMVHTDLFKQNLILKLEAHHVIKRNQSLLLTIHTDKVHLFDYETQINLTTKLEG